MDRTQQTARPSRPAIPIAGVELVEFDPHEDDRGCFTEVFREKWTPGMRPVQWNVVRSKPDVLRGVHCHVDHSDYLMLLDGAMLLGLHDLRPQSPTRAASTLIEMEPSRHAVVIPPGVAHGFWFTAPSTTLYAVTHEWNQADELGCRFDDPELGLAWPHIRPHLSSRDATAGSLSVLRDAVQAALAARASEPDDS